MPIKAVLLGSMNLMTSFQAVNISSISLMSWFLAYVLSQRLDQLSSISKTLSAEFCGSHTRSWRSQSVRLREAWTFLC